MNRMPNRYSIPWAFMLTLLFLMLGLIQYVKADDHSANAQNAVAGDNTMIKYILLAKRKSGMSRQAFVDYYENNHVPLAESLWPILKTVEKRRNFMIHDQVLIPSDFNGEIDYDVITETIFPLEVFNEFLAGAADPEKARLLAEDEENLFDRSTMRYFAVEVHDSEIHPAK